MSSKTFPLLADKIESSVENAAKNSGIQKNLEPIYTYIQVDEVLLFFDRGENYTVYLEGEKTLSPDNIFFSPREKPVSYFAENLEPNLGWSYAFKKPTQCDDSACMVLCSRSNMVTFLYNYLDVKFSDYTPSLKNAFLVYCSKPKQLKVFDNINKFYRKPYFAECRSSNVVTGKAIIGPKSLIPGLSKAPVVKPLPTDLKLNRFVLPGALMRASCFYPASKAGKDMKKELDTLGKSEFTFGFASRDYVGEFRDGSWVNTTLLTGQYIYTQAFNNNIVLCYSPPCLSQTDELYINWGNHADICFNSSNQCSLLSSDIERYASNNKVVFRRDTGILNIKQGDYDFTYGMQVFQFTKTLDLEVELEKDDGSVDASYPVDTLSLEYDDAAVVKKIRLDADGKQFSYIGVSSEQGLYPMLKFIVKAYNPKV
jgi:hypothetical protein